jgi:hypothetical protein
MLGRTLGVVAVGLVVCGLSAQAGSGRVVGVITSVAGPSMDLRARGSETRQIRTDATTSYMKWITHRPWQQDSTATGGSLVIGRCVDVVVRADDPTTAKVVRVSDEPATSLFDPCKTLR